MRSENTNPGRSGFRSWIAITEIALMGGFATGASAQVQWVELYGTVTDATGGVLPGVDVTVSSPQLITGSQSTVTGDQRRGVDYPEFDANGERYRSSRVDVAVEQRGTHRVDFRNILNLRVEKFFRGL